MRLRHLNKCLLIFILQLSLLKGHGTKKKIKATGKIVGGKPVSLTSYPSAVLFYNVGAQCSGSILNSWSILTAAHCFDINRDKTNMVVEVGARYLYDFNSKTHEVKSFIIHPDYNRTAMFSCDIALIFVEKPFQFNNKVKKAILVTHSNWMKTGEKHFQAIGWGWTLYGGSVSEEGLMMTELEFVTSQDCSRMHQLTIGPDMFCLYGHGSKDTCRGDSGGAIWWNGMIVGITSHGDGCAKKNKPSVYANLWYFRNWIRDEVVYFITNHCEDEVSYK